MDKKYALTICRNYLLRLRNNNIYFTNAWIFGSYARGNQHKDSDIDVAIVMNDDAVIPFETEVKLMTFRIGEETLIEPHVFTQSDFDQSHPLAAQILKFGEQIEL